MSQRSEMRKEMITLFNKLKSKYENRFNKLLIYQEHKEEIDYWAFLKALSEMPNCCQVECMRLGDETLDKLERKYVEERIKVDERYHQIRRKKKKLTTVYGSKEIDLDSPY